MQGWFIGRFVAAYLLPVNGQKSTNWKDIHSQFARFSPKLLAHKWKWQCLADWHPCYLSSCHNVTSVTKQPSYVVVCPHSSTADVVLAFVWLDTIAIALLFACTIATWHTIAFVAGPSFWRCFSVAVIPAFNSDLLKRVNAILHLSHLPLLSQDKGNT